MTITIDLSNPYVITTLLFFGALGVTNLLLQVKAIQLKRRLVMQKVDDPKAQVEALIELVDTLVTFIEEQGALMKRAGITSTAEEFITKARHMCARFKRDAGL